MQLCNLLLVVSLGVIGCGEDGQGGIFGGDQGRGCFSNNYCSDTEYCSKDGVCRPRQQTPVQGIGCDGTPGPVMRLRTLDFVVTVEWLGPNGETLRTEQTPAAGVITAPDHACRVVIRPCDTARPNRAWATLPGLDGLEYTLYRLEPDGSWGAQNDGGGRAAADAHCAP